ncbi:M15 family metallopeptidase [Nocardioides sp. B-3]|uniref:M15 family metallopeptidase n=1 Tax=Nocardioides sp. B-3 TaxID=2895565 RepID=UPI003FA5969D
MARRSTSTPSRTPTSRATSCCPSSPAPTCAEMRCAGMIVDAGPVIAAFARIGWEWGGDWNQSKDYQHFSQNGL